MSLSTTRRTSSSCISGRMTTRSGSRRVCAPRSTWRISSAGPDCNLILQSVREQGATLGAAKGVRFRIELAAESVPVEGDPDFLERLVCDTGIGIHDADLPNLFERFYRVDKARSRESCGAGLGRAIGRWIARAHGGEIEVESAPGRGTQFRVQLPVDTARWAHATGVTSS